MQHSRINTPCYEIWVYARPSSNGKGKDAYQEAVRKAARALIDGPINVSDIEVEISYSTDTKPAERMDADNVSKPTLDALKGIAYRDDSQVRPAGPRIFERNKVTRVKEATVEQVTRLLHTTEPHVVLIQIYSDSRLAELRKSNPDALPAEGGPPEFEPSTVLRNEAVSVQEDEFIPSAGVYRDPNTGHYVCPRCRSENKRSLIVDEREGFRCPVCSNFFVDHSRRTRSGLIDDDDRDYGPHSWMR